MTRPTMPAQYAHTENIKRYERLLLTETDAERRGLLSRLLAEERKKDGKPVPRIL